MARERDYQLGVVLSPEAGEDQARAVVDRVNNLVATNGGQVFRVNAWGRRRLAYPIEHHRDGLYFWFDMQLPADSVVEVERQLRVNEAIIRHLLTLRDARVVAQERVRAEEADALAAEAEARAAALAAERAAAGGAEMGEPVEMGTADVEAAEGAEADEAEAGEIEEEAEV